MQAVDACGDGACALHAAWGVPGPRRELFVDNARALAAGYLNDFWHAPDEGDVNRQRCAQAICASLWTDFVVPVLQKENASVEGGLFWQAVQKANPDLAHEAQTCFKQKFDQEAQRARRSSQIVDACRRLFQRQNERCLRDVAVRLQYLPPNLDVFSLSEAQIKELVRTHPEFQDSYLQSASGLDGYIRGMYENCRRALFQHNFCLTIILPNGSATNLK